MKDIRNFFGSTASNINLPKQENLASNQATKINSTSCNNVAQAKCAADDILTDSDEDNNDGLQRSRKRLKSSKAVSKSPDINKVISVVKTDDAQLSDAKHNAASTELKSETINCNAVDVDLTIGDSESFLIQQNTEVQLELPTLKQVQSNHWHKSVKEVELKNASDFFNDSTNNRDVVMETPSIAIVERKIKREEEKLLSSVKKTRLNVSTISGTSSDSVSDSKHILVDKKFVVTGVMASGVGREQLEDLILSHGGKIAKAVSGKTDYLVTGALLEDGRQVCEGNKYRMAVEKSVRVISEEELMVMVAAVATEKSKKIALQLPSVPSNHPQHSQSILSSSSSSSSSNDGLLWVDKHKPQNSSELIGSGELVKKMSDWLRRWDAVHLTKTVKVPFAKDNPGAKAVLLSGPPGIGKTTVASLIAKEFNYDVLELNASDTRSKKDVGDHLSDAVLSRAIAADGSTSLRRRLVVMDEVDGMGGSDRGGVAELIRIIKLSKTPVVCICNDRMSTKIRSLANHCYDLKVKRPTKQQIATRLVSIAQKEGMQVDQNAAEMLVEQVGNDIRQALNSMQMWRASSNHMQFSEMKDGMHRIEKDKVLRQTAFDACMQILGGSRGGSNLDDRYNSFFIDYSLIPLLVQQNFVDAAKSGVFKSPLLDEGQKMEALSTAADAVSDMELIGAGIMGQDQHWELLPAQAALSTRVGCIIQGFQAFPAFPAWLGKNSTKSKMSRLTREIVHHSALSIGQGFCPIRLDYVPYLRSTLLQLLLKNNNNSGENTDSIAQVIELLDSYGLDRDDFMETLREMQFVVEGDKQFTDRFADIETKVKSALTRAYNSGSHRSQVLVSEVASKGMKRSRTTTSSSGGGGGYDEDGLPLEEGGGEEDEALVEDVVDEETTEKDAIAAFVAKCKKTAAHVKASKAVDKLAKSKTTGTKKK